MSYDLLLLEDSNNIFLRKLLQKDYEDYKDYFKQIMTIFKQYQNQVNFNMQFE